MKATGMQMIRFMVCLCVGGGFMGLYINQMNYNPWYFMLGYAIWFNSLIYNHAENDVKKIIEGYHVRRFIIRGLVIGLISIITALMIWRNEQVNLFLLFLAFVSFSIGLFMFCFDVYYNWHKGRRGWDLFYLGNQAWQDLTFNESKGLLFAVDTTALIAGGYFLYHQLNIY